MAAGFDDVSLEEALRRSVRNAKHLRVRDAALVRAAFDLARKIDAWDQIVDWAIEDAAESGGRPAVPANDNVSLATFLKFMTTLGLVPPEQEAQHASSRKGQPVSELDKWRSKKAKSG